MMHSLPVLKRSMFFFLFFMSLISFSQERYVGSMSLYDPDDMPQIIAGTSFDSYEGMSFYFTKSVTLKEGFHVTGADGGFSILPLATNPPPTNSNNQNYVRVEVPSVEVSTENDLTNLNSDDKSTSYSYSDGVGRTMMTSAAEAGPNKEDIVQYMYYDPTTGRQDKSYMPYSKPQSDPGQFIADPQTETENFYSSPPDATLPSDNTPYSFTEFDARGRVKSVMAPGDMYRNPDKKTSYNYEVYDPTTDPSKIAHWKIVSGVPVNDRYYVAKELSIVEVTDVEGRKTRTVTDMRGLTITSQVYDPSISVANKWIGTYNVYDDYGRIRFTIPPMLNAYVLNSNFQSKSITTEQVDELLFQYEYDERGRTERTKAPGAGWVEFVYDKWDRVVLSRHQTLMLDGANAWSFVKYDALNRSIITGLVKDSRSRSQLQTLLNTKTDRYEESNNGEDKYGYSINTSFPRLGSDYSSSNYEIHSINYFDNYLFLDHASWDEDITDQSDFDLSLPSGFSASELTNTINRSTGSKVLILGSTTYLNTIVYYDEDGRILQTAAENHLGGIDRLTNQLDWKGEMSKMLLEHTSDESIDESVAILSEYEYDEHTGQLLKSFQTIAESYPLIDANDRVEVADYHYNIMGELVEKNLHSTNGSSYLQSVDYRYNFNGALNSINKANLTAGNDSDLFGMEYQYEDPMTVGNTAIPGRYDGVATSMQWNASNVTASVDPTTGPEGTNKTALGFKYDERNRLSSAHFGQTTSIGSNTYDQKPDHFGMSATYDNNGNIENLSRKSDGTEIDNLDYDYLSNSNKLKSVDDDATDATAKLEGFDEETVANGTLTEYAYDAMGNMIEDDNKEIVLVEYNHMQYVTKIEFWDGTKVVNTYDAAGNKLSKKIIDSDDNIIAKVDYVGLLEYLNDEINQVFTDEGRAYKQNGEYHYEYFIKDHQQNNRLSFGILPERNVYTATMESDRSAYEESHFTFPAGIRYDAVGANADKNHTPLGKGSIYLNGAVASRQLGPAKVLDIKPGDEVDLEVWAKYNTSSSSAGSFGDIIGALMSAYGLQVSDGGAGEAISNTLSSVSGGYVPTSNSSSGSDAPDAYLAYLFFDDNYSYDPDYSGFLKVEEDTDEHFNKIGTISPLKFDGNGHLFVYLANETHENQEVYFDDLKITHSSAIASFKVSQVNEYYPFGLPTANSWRAPGYIDPGLLYQSSYASFDSLTGYYDFLSRSYDPTVGRFFQVDPANQFMSPYVGMGNMPHFVVDPDGEFIHILIGAAIGGVINLGIKAYQGKIGSFGDGLKAFGIGALAGGVGAATGGAAFLAAGGAAGGVGGFAAGAIGGMIGSAFSLPILSVGNHVGFGDPLMTGKEYLTGIALGGLIGGTVQGISAVSNGRNFWNGGLRGHGPTPVAASLQGKGIEAPKPAEIPEPTLKRLNTNSNSQVARTASTNDPLKANGLRIGGDGIDDGINLKPFVKANFRDNLKRLTGVNPASDMHAHHIIPNQFAKNSNLVTSGINVHSPSNGIWVPRTVHTQIHREAYNSLWRQFLSAPRSSSEIRLFSQQMLIRFGLN